MKKGFIPNHGNYESLLSYQKSKIIYDATHYFSNRYFKKFDRTIDQMVQAARSGKQNIIEGSMASATSKETEIKLTNVARASLEELLEDYKDYLRINSLSLWNKDSKEATYVRKLGISKKESFETYREFLETRPPETSANIIICLIHQCNFLLNQQIRKLEREFIINGGLRENMFKARKQYRSS